MLRPAGLWLVLISLLSGCRDQAAPSGPAGDTANYLPTALGSRWLYAVTNTGTHYLPDGQVLEQLTASDLGDGPATRKRLSAMLDSANFYYTYFRKTPTALLQVFTPSFTTFPGPLGSLPELRLPLRSGDHYLAYDFHDQDYGADIDGDGRNERIDLRLEVTVGEVETVTVPAGRFSNARHVHSQLTRRVRRSTDGTAIEFTADTDDWYVPQVGLVQSHARMDGTSGPGTAVRELRGYRVAGAGTDLQAPGVVQTSPRAGDTAPALSHGTPTPITLTFSEDMDPYSLAPPWPATPAALVIRDAGNTPVAGTLRYQSRQLVFTPTAVLAPGLYTATLSGATDALGNALPGHVWRFTLY